MKTEAYGSTGCLFWQKDTATYQQNGDSYKLVRSAYQESAAKCLVRVFFTPMSTART
jgi:hypothetical protein